MRAIALFLTASLLCAQQPAFFPVSEVRAGQRGVGKTVFSGSRVEEFQVEILGVLENAGPKQSLILAKLSGGPLGQTGVMQGMSGSPVYINGRLVGAVSASFPFSKEPIAGIQPIEQMLRTERPVPEQPQASNGLANISTPISFSGFTTRTIEHFAPQLRGFGLEPRQGNLGGGASSGAMGNPSLIEPGSMISVQLITGDLQVGADGTVTHIDGKRVYAFGHRFMMMGTTEMPFARAEVLTLLPSVNSSFKISASRETMGSITSDHSTAIAGELGKAAAMVPVNVSVKDRGAYRMQVINDRTLTPYLVQMATFNVVDATERAVGVSTLISRVKLTFDGPTPPVELRNITSSDTNIALAASSTASSPVSYALDSGFAELKVKQIDIDLEPSEADRRLTIGQAWASKTYANPGETIDIYASLDGPGGFQLTRKSPFTIPAGMQPGVLQIAVSEAASANLAEFQHLLLRKPDSAAQVLEVLRGYRSNAAVYATISRVEPSFQVQGHVLPDPPPSLALLLKRATGNASITNPLVPLSRVAELRMDVDGYMVTGNKTIQIQVVE